MENKENKKSIRKNFFNGWRKIIIGGKLNLVLTSILLSVGIGIFMLPAFAAEIFFGTNFKELAIGSTFEIGVFVNTNGERINAFEGDIIFPAELLSLHAIQDGNSIINLWLSRPRLMGDKISFAGMIPGGYIGEDGYLFSLIFNAKNSGTAEIGVENEIMLLNDGYGRPAGTVIAPLSLEITETGRVQDFFQMSDYELPEPFDPLLTRDPEIFDNQWFLVFVSQDKISGIKWYEVKEEKDLGILGFLAKPKPWRITESPYLLQDQSLQSHIYVKAIDNAGNERLAVVLPQNPLDWYLKPLLWEMIILFIFFISLTFILWRFLSKKR